MKPPPTFLLLLALGLVGPPIAHAAAEDTSAPARYPLPALLALTLLALIGAAIAVYLAQSARRLAELAAQEAGQARARATQPDTAVTAEALAGTERVWAARIAAIEAQLAPILPRLDRARPSAPSPELVLRLEEVERVVAGLGVALKELRHQPPPTAATEEAPDIAWPSCLSAATPALHDLRQTLAQALKSSDPNALALLDHLRAADLWAGSKPGTEELSRVLTEISTLLSGALRRGAAVAPLDGALLSDRVLAALRPLWKGVHPYLDCRCFFPGATFDPDWMEAPSDSALQRPVISEMISWAVFERVDRQRRIFAKARVITD